MKKSLRYDKHYVSDYDDGIVRGEETTDSVCLVDVKGYIPMAKQIERQILAGQRLEAFRRGDFDVDANYNGEFIEPSVTSHPDFMPSVDMLSAMSDLDTKINTSANQQTTEPKAPESLEKVPEVKE